MKRTMLIVLIAVFVAVGANSLASAANSVVVESKSVQVDETGVTAGAFIENDVDLASVQLVLEWREVTPGSYITNSWSYALQNRVAGSALLDFETVRTFATPGAQSCSGPTSSTYNSGVIGAPDYVSPDGFFWNGLSTGIGVFAAGNDGATPSFLFTFDVTGTQGTFEIDTCCSTPANHIAFVDAATFSPIDPSFTKGVITIGGNAVKEAASTGVLPTTFAISQNYPNPFNASTIIPFEVAYPSHVTIQVYDILGRQVATVVDDEYDQGRYTVDWNGTNKRGESVATGVYFYRMTSDESVSTRKMVLLK